MIDNSAHIIDGRSANHQGKAATNRVFNESSKSSQTTGATDAGEPFLTVRHKSGCPPPRRALRGNRAWRSHLWSHPPTFLRVDWYSNRRSHESRGRRPYAA